MPKKQLPRRVISLLDKLVRKILKSHLNKASNLKSKLEKHVASTLMNNDLRNSFENKEFLIIYCFYSPVIRDSSGPDGIHVGKIFS